MVVIIPKKRQCKKCFGVGYVCALLSAALLICYLTGVKMTAWNDFIGEGAQGLEGGRTSLFPRSLSPLYNYQKTLWGKAEDSSVEVVMVGSQDKGGGDEVAGAKVKRGVDKSGSGGAVVKSDSGQVGVVSDKGNFNTDDLSGKHSLFSIVSQLTIMQSVRYCSICFVLHEYFLLKFILHIEHFKFASIAGREIKFSLFLQTLKRWML